ncbi:E3 ubiquitin-protein ligase RNF19B [Fulvia fulva]|uniref:E3 ubiquitin-protein ligase RNF19B n=1 Tax=Passalora fulva TaxID=5499 RepID=A0A9Q8PF78_PASFU|nr:E3 ubiquitin-protein ligase RNF19B [Fulvia fulva]KAK4617727.1 E3 ubiquitin-protein ligase RNF19B [Fulvia fulva]KAK4619190.1 E3 ubiquitin-protein ligase RNF19B [Fulvia fulva]UJO21331.1 E3 ubiquitin-protein ligase RNF19B [Fulvia fulva]WPV18177.1 E3 ubiquitin-protein ligase RNF19B [Fulvia fulva]WPV33237.1 E3 ubiquitin-protein ligase RNF19B [Fulvia fulva]
MAPRTECTTCERRVQTSSLPRVCKDSGCDHGRETCRRCWHKWIETQVKGGAALDQISCIQCSNVLVQSDIKKLCTGPVYTAYEDALLKAALSQDPDFRWCISPKCKGGQIHHGGDIFTCNSCRHKACVHCNVAWHPEETCEAYKQRMQIQPGEEEASAKALEKVAKLCPRCSRKLQKNG